MNDQQKLKVLAFIEKNPSFFRQQCAWFKENWHIFEAFAKTTLALIDKGRSHYSARTIVEVLRHHSILGEVAGQWKLNDHAAPDLARAFVIAHPEHIKFWEYRRPNHDEFVAAVSVEGLPC
jgi:hypothetical protein